MSELRIDELQAETGELLPERETLGVVIQNFGFANAQQAFTIGSHTTAVNVENVTLIGSFNHAHN